MASLRASSPGRSGGGAGRESEGIWIPPPIPLWLLVDWAVRFPPISTKWKRARIKQTLKNAWKHPLRVMTSLLMSSPPISISHWLFRCIYSNSSDVVASPPSFSRPAARVPQGACSQAPELFYDWSEHNKHSWTISSVHGFPARTVTFPDANLFTFHDKTSKCAQKQFYWWIIINLQKRNLKRRVSKSKTKMSSI